MANYTKKFEELSSSDRSLVGGKCASLGEMVQAGLPVPAGFAVTVDAYEDFRDTGDLLHCRGLTLDILVCVPDSYHPDRNRATVHHMIVPAATYDRRSWQRWLFDQCRLVDVHEAMEIFEVNGVRPYAPHHGPGNDPYLIFEHGSDEDVATSFLGQVKTDV